MLRYGPAFKREAYRGIGVEVFVRDPGWRYARNDIKVNALISPFSTPSHGLTPNFTIRIKILGISGWLFS